MRNSGQWATPRRPTPWRSGRRRIAMIDWNSPEWGEPGTNVHHASNGSWWSEADNRDES